MRKGITKGIPSHENMESLPVENRLTQCIADVLLHRFNRLERKSSFVPWSKGIRRCCATMKVIS